MSSSSVHVSCLLSYELTILKLRNLEPGLPSPGNLFIRYYFKPGSERTFRVDNTKIIPCNSDNSFASVNHKALFECKVISAGDSPSFIEDIKKKKKAVVLELRWRRRSYKVLGLKLPMESKVLARVEVPWKDDLEEKWVRLEQRNRELKGKKEIEVLVRFRLWEREIVRKEIECDCEECKFGWKGGDVGDDACF